MKCTFNIIYNLDVSYDLYTYIFRQIYINLHIFYYSAYFIFCTFVAERNASSLCQCNFFCFRLEKPFKNRVPFDCVMCNETCMLLFLYTNDSREYENRAKQIDYL